MADDMQINPQRAKQLAENLASITSRISAANKTGRQVPRPPAIPPQMSNIYIYMYMLINTPGPPHSSLQTQTRDRHPLLTPTHLHNLLVPTPPHALRRKLRPRTPREIQTPTQVYKVAFHRRPPIEQVQAARRADPKSVVRKQRRQREEGRWTREGAESASRVFVIVHGDSREAQRQSAGQHQRRGVEIGRRACRCTGAVQAHCRAVSALATLGPHDHWRDRAV